MTRSPAAKNRGHGTLERYEDGCRCGLCIIAKCHTDEEWHRRKYRRTAECGTHSGYNSHINHGETPCQGCRDATAAYHRLRRGRGKIGRVSPMSGVRRVPLFPPPNTFTRCESGCGRLVWDFDLGLCGACAA